jgi:hypothetical protein
MSFYLTVKMDGYIEEDSIRTWNLDPAVTAADVGKPMTINGANRLAVAVDNSIIYGRLDVFEDRTTNGGGKIGACATRGGWKWTGVSGHTLTPGSYVQGAALGTIKSIATFSKFVVSEVVGNVITVVNNT